jgi:hypothetical protein
MSRAGGRKAAVVGCRGEILLEIVEFQAILLKKRKGSQKEMDEISCRNELELLGDYWKSTNFSSSIR